MLLFPNCKINIGLNIIRKRNDGFHDLETIFYPIKNLYDALEVIKHDNDGFQQSGASNTSIHYTSTGLSIMGDKSDNLCIKAYQLLKNDFPEIAGIRMHLHKTIPMGAGLGGGSADGAFMLRLLNEKFQLNLTQQQLMGYALQLGSDCPFFIYNQPCFATGRGEKLTPITLDLSDYSIVLVNPNIHINTGWAFAQITPQQPATSLQQAILQPIETWKQVIVNDFEAAVIQAHPVVGGIKTKMYANGAVFSTMSGSGSTVFGIFRKNILKEKLFGSFAEWQLDL